MKKILILLFLLAPLLASAQYWYIVDAMNMDRGYGWEGWNKCKSNNIRVFTDEKSNVKIFTQNTVSTYRTLGDYQYQEEDNGDVTLSWKCVTESGEICKLSMIYYSGAVTVILITEHKHLSFAYNMTPDPM